MNKKSHKIDPGILEIVGAVTQVLGLAETIQKVLPTDIVMVKRRHKRIDSLIKKVVSAMDDARMALLGISDSIKIGANDLQNNEHTMDISKSDFEILKRGTMQLHEAIKRMTNTAFELEAVTAAIAQK